MLDTLEMSEMAVRDVLFSEVLDVWEEMAAGVGLFNEMLDA